MVELETLRRRLETSEELARRQATRITELEARLAAHDRLAGLRLVISGVIHEVNNMLTGALGFTYLLGRSPLAEIPREHRMLATVTGELNRCATLTRHLLRYSREVHQPELEPFELGGVVRETTEALAEEFMVDGVLMQLELEPEPIHLVGVRVQIQDVVRHLLLNAREAIRATGRPGWIRIRLGLEEQAILLEVADSGGGFREPERAFEPFYTTRESVPCAGLGLVMVKSVVKDHGGRIQLTEGEAGAVFSMRFPVGRRAAISISASDSTTRL